MTRLISPQGVALAPPLRVDTSKGVYIPAISSDTRGGFVAAWERIGNPDLFIGRLLSASGDGTGSELEINTPGVGTGWGGPAVGLPSGAVYFWRAGVN